MIDLSLRPPTSQRFGTAPRPADLTCLREKHRPSCPREAVGQHVCVTVLYVHRFQNIPLMLRGPCILGRSAGWQVAHHPLRLTLKALLWGFSTCPVAGCPRSWQRQCQRHHVPSRGDGLAGAWLCPSPALSSSPHHPSVSLAFSLLMKGSAPSSFSFCLLTGPDARCHCPSCLRRKPRLSPSPSLLG